MPKFTVLGVYLDTQEHYDDTEEPQPQRWGDTFEALNATEAARMAREETNGELAVAGVLAGECQVVA